jgi:galactokinase
MAVGFALLTLTGKTTESIDRIALARAGQKAEHDYVGTRCGIMDQLASARAAARCALLIDCRTLRVEDVPLPPGDVAILVTDSKKKHELASSEYNTRREECEAAVEAIRSALPEVRSLRDVEEADLGRLGALLPDPLFRRARHVVTENARTLAVVSALERGDWRAAGAAFVESHRSLKNDYEVSADELDHLVDVAIGEPGVLGARMTGGGFGGSTVTLVEEKHLDAVKERLRSSFAARFGLEPGFLVTRGGASARELELRR